MLPNTAFCDGMQQKNNARSELWTHFLQEKFLKLMQLWKLDVNKFV